MFHLPKNLLLSFIGLGGSPYRCGFHKAPQLNCALTSVCSPI